MQSSHLHERMKKLGFINLPLGLLSLILSFTVFDTLAEQIPLWLNTSTCWLGTFNYYWLLRFYPRQKLASLVLPLLLYATCLLAYGCILIIFIHTLTQGAWAAQSVYLIIGFQIIDSTEHFVLKMVDGKMRWVLFDKRQQVLGGATWGIIAKNYRWLRQNSPAS
jgi:hypothetical protein